MSAYNSNNERRQILIHANEFHSCTHCILEQLEHDVVKMGGHGHNGNLLVRAQSVQALQLHRGRGQIVAVTEKPGILVGIAYLDKANILGAHTVWIPRK